MSSGVSSEELDILLLLLSMLGSRGSSRPRRLLQFSHFSLFLSLFRDPPFLGGLKKYEEFGGLTIFLLKILGKFKGKNLIYI